MIIVLLALAAIFGFLLAGVLGVIVVLKAISYAVGRGLNW